MTYVLVNYPRFKAFTANGDPAVGYLLYSYEPGGTTPLVTYSERTCTTPNDNPTELDSVGEAVVYVKQATKLVLKTEAGVTVWTMDYIGEQQANFVTGSSTPVTVDNNYVVTTSPAVAALTNNFMLIMTPDLDNADTITSNTFTGTGSDDCTASGPYLGSTSDSVFSVKIDSTAAQIDANIKVLLHGDGTGATIVDSCAVPKTVTVVGNTTQSAVQSKFGGKSILFDGTGDYLTLADSDDWYLGDTDFTIECWIRFTTVADATLFGQYASAANNWRLDYTHSTHAWKFVYEYASVTLADYELIWTPTVDTWYHIALVRNGTVLSFCVNGEWEPAWTTITIPISTTSLTNIASVLCIGYDSGTGFAFTGYMDEICFSKGIARWVTDFPAPTQAYSTDGVDTFKWKKDGGAYTTGVAITGAAQNIIEGLVVTFATITGHTFDDLWAIVVKTPARVNLDGLGNLLVYKNQGGAVVALSGSDMIAGYPAQLILNEALSGWLLINPATPTFSVPTISAVRHRKNVTAAYDQLLADQGYELSCVGTFTITLLTPPEFASRFFYIKNAGIGTITVDAGAYTINWAGVPTNTITLSQGVSVQLVTNGVDWHVVTDTSFSSGYLLLDTAGTYAWSAVSTTAYVKLCGGGGGSTQFYSAGGGGYLEGWIDLTPGTSYNLVVGAGGAKSQYGSADEGGASSVGALITVPGGKGATQAANGAAGNLCSNPGTGGPGSGTGGTSPFTFPLTGVNTCGKGADQSAAGDAGNAGMILISW